MLLQEKKIYSLVEELVLQEACRVYGVKALNNDIMIEGFMDTLKSFFTNSESKGFTGIMKTVSSKLDSLLSIFTKDLEEEKDGEQLEEAALLGSWALAMAVTKLFQGLRSLSLWSAKKLNLLEEESVDAFNKYHPELHPLLKAGSFEKGDSWTEELEGAKSLKDLDSHHLDPKKLEKLKQSKLFNVLIKTKVWEHHIEEILSKPFKAFGIALAKAYSYLTPGLDQTTQLKIAKSFYKISKFIFLCWGLQHFLHELDVTSSIAQTIKDFLIGTAKTEEVTAFLPIGAEGEGLVAVGLVSFGNKLENLYKKVKEASAKKAKEEQEALEKSKVLQTLADSWEYYN